MAGQKLIRRVVFQVAQETTVGQESAGPFTALLARSGSQIAVNGETVTRDVLRDTLSPRGHVVGMKDQQITMPLELRGAGLGGSNTLQVPELDALWLACSYARESGAYLAVTGASGDFTRGETVTNTTASNTAGTVADWDSVNGVLYLRALQTMPSAGDTLTGDTSAATADVTSADDAYVYRPDSPDVANMPALSCHYFLDGIRHKVLASRATATLDLTVGQIPAVNFTLTGTYVAPDDSPNPSVSYLQLVPEPVFGAKILLGSLDMTQVAVNALTLDLGNDVQWRDDIQAAAGHKEPLVVGRDPTGSIDPDVLDLATWNPYSEWEAGSLVAVGCGIGSAAGRRVRVVCPETQYTNLPYGDRNGIATYQLGFRATGTDDELMVIYS